MTAGGEKHPSALSLITLDENLIELSRLRFLPRPHHRGFLPTKGIESSTYAPIQAKFLNWRAPIEWLGLIVSALWASGPLERSFSTQADNILAKALSPPSTASKDVG